LAFLRLQRPPAGARERGIALPPPPDTEGWTGLREGPPHIDAATPTTSRLCSEGPPSRLGRRATAGGGGECRGVAPAGGRRLAGRELDRPPAAAGRSSFAPAAPHAGPPHPPHPRVAASARPPAHRIRIRRPLLLETCASSAASTPRDPCRQRRSAVGEVAGGEPPRVGGRAGATAPLPQGAADGGRRGRARDSAAEARGGRGGRHGRKVPLSPPLRPMCTPPAKTRRPERSRSSICRQILRASI
jgi:hypothetical protein